MRRPISLPFPNLLKSSERVSFLSRSILPGLPVKLNARIRVKCAVANSRNERLFTALVMALHLPAFTSSCNIPFVLTHDNSSGQPQWQITGEVRQRDLSM